MQTGLTGEYNLVVTRPDGSTTETGWFKNLILDQGLDRIGISGNVINYCQIGTGTTAPSFTQTSLQSYTAGCQNTSISVVNAGSPTYSSAHTIAYPFAQGAVVGNMAEIGVGWLATGNNLFSRALITDSGGNPTTITVTSIDQLTVYYKITFIPDLNIGTGQVILAGSTYDYVSSLAYAGSVYSANGLFVGYDFYSPGYGAGSPYAAAPASTTTLGPNTTGLTNEQSFGVNGQFGPQGSTAAYINNTYYRDTTWFVPVGIVNFTGGIGGVRPVFGSYPGDTGYYKYIFTPAIPKDNTKTFSLTFRISWARA